MPGVTNAPEDALVSELQIMLEESTKISNAANRDLEILITFLLSLTRAEDCNEQFGVCED